MVAVVPPCLCQPLRIFCGVATDSFSPKADSYLSLSPGFKVTSSGIFVLFLPHNPLLSYFHLQCITSEEYFPESFYNI